MSVLCQVSLAYSLQPSELREIRHTAVCSMMSWSLSSPLSSTDKHTSVLIWLLPFTPSVAHQYFFPLCSLQYQFPSCIRWKISHELGWELCLKAQRTHKDVESSRSKMSIKTATLHYQQKRLLLWPVMVAIV